MKTAIEVLERSLKSHTNTRNSWASITDEDLYEDVADFDEKISEIKAAIDYLQRKVKKDPRADGLPTDRKTLLIWKIDEDIPLGGYYNLSRNKWIVFTSAKPYPTDEILFYADPNDIL